MKDIYSKEEILANRKETQKRNEVKIGQAKCKVVQMTLEEIKCWALLK